MVQLTFAGSRRPVTEPRRLYHYCGKLEYSSIFFDRFSIVSQGQYYGNAMTDTNQTDELLRRVADGDDRAASELLQLHRQRLRRMVAIRLDDRVSATGPGKAGPRDPGVIYQ